MAKGQNITAVPCSPDAYRLGGVRLGSGTMGKLGRAWVGAWGVHGMVYGCLVVVML